MSESLLRTRNVFLDTEAYEHQRFRFDHAALRKLRELGRIGFLHILVTDTVDGEMREHIRSDLEDAVKSFGRFQGHAGVLASAPAEEYEGLFRQLDPAKTRESGLVVWDAFLRDAKVERVSAGSVHGPELLELYFSQQPPFSEKKKSEFPDAISLLSLAHWCQDNTAELLVVGDDPDLRAWCAEHAEMHHIESLSDFLDLYNRAEEKLSALVRAIFEREEEWIVSVIEESFLECTFLYPENWEADVENVEITSTRVDDVDLIEVDEQRFVLALQMQISFRADVSGPDYEHGWWDSEDKRYLALPSFRAEITSTENYGVSFGVKYDLAKEEATEITEVLFNDGREIKVRDEHGWPYK
jgi:hypothetical protein